jgi:hypothetical protein
MFWKQYAGDLTKIKRLYGTVERRPHMALLEHRATLGKTEGNAKLECHADKAT